MTTLVSMHTGELAELIRERDALRKQVDALQERMSAMVNDSLYRRVRTFHVRFGHPVRHTPTVPSEEEIRFRLALILEEFRELFESALDGSGVTQLEASWEVVRAAISGPYPYQNAAVRVDFPAFIDALADLAYVIEGTSAVAGVRLEPILAEVQRANMAKDPAYVAGKDASHRAGHAKPRKPEGWIPPDIEGVLREQGWTGGEGR